MPMKTRQLKIYEMQQKKSKEFIAIKSYLKKQEKHRTDSLTLYLKQLEKEKDPKISRRNGEGIGTHRSTLAWKIPWTEEPGGPQSMGSLSVRHDWVTSLSLFTFMRGEGNGNPLQCSCLENPRDGGASWAAVYEVAQSRTRLKRLSSSSSKECTTNLFLKT